MNKRLTPLTMLYIGILAGILGLIYWGDRAVTVLAENTPPERKICFIIDAGHGGVDGGATSCTGMLESAFNLEIALRLDSLMRFLGYRTNMIRREDISIYTKGETISQKKVSDLKERVRICNETPGAVLLSIHQNYFSDSRYFGAQVFYPATEGSEAFAKNLQASMIKSLNPGSRRNAKKAQGIYLMEHIQCPGILIECGFLSNPEEEGKLRSPEHQKKLCCVIAAAAVSYANT